MPLLSVLAPGTRVRVKGMELPGAEVAAVRVKAGVNPVKYDVSWLEGEARHTARFEALAVEAIDQQLAPTQKGRLGELGALLAAQQSEQGQT